MTVKIEKRAGQTPEVRADGAQVEGYAAVFGEWADIGGVFLESIAPGAFSGAIGRDNVPFLIEHSGLPLARTGSGTLTLTEDEKGLHIATELDAADPDVARILPKMRRGDLDKMSFAFIASREEWDETGEIPRRTILEVDLYDVAIVTTPAYSGTEIGLRSLEAHRAKRRTHNFHAARRRKMRRQLMGLNLPIRAENG